LHIKSPSWSVVPVVIEKVIEKVVVIEKVLNEELITVNNWTHKNFLFLNKHKTEVVIFGTDARISQVSCFKVNIGNYELTRVSDLST